MTNETTPFKDAHDLDYGLMDRIITNMDLDNMNMMDVCRRVFEGTAMYYSLMYYESKKEEMYMYDKVLEKNKMIEELEDEIISLRERLSEDSEGTPDEVA